MTTTTDADRAALELAYSALVRDVMHAEGTRQNLEWARERDRKGELVTGLVGFVNEYEAARAVLAGTAQRYAWIFDAELGRLAEEAGARQFLEPSRMVRP